MARLNPNKSNQIRTQHDGYKSFPTRDDLLDSMVSNGLVTDFDDLIDQHPNYIADIQLAWITSGQTACRFAQMLAKDHEQAKWGSYIVTQKSLNRLVFQTINDTLDQSVGTYEAFQIIFPYVQTPEDIRDMLNGFVESNGRWILEQFSSGDAKVDSITQQVGMRWILPDEQHINWILGFADIKTMPVTRQAPFTSIVVRPGLPGPSPDIVGHAPRSACPRTGLIPVHLADMELNNFLASELQVKNVWESTQKLKKELLSYDLYAPSAKAKISFSLPKRLVLKTQS